MSGKPRTPSGDRDQHIQAARNWLDRAEKQFSDGQSVLASATLMLARAELKLTIEAVTAGVIETVPEKHRTPFRLVPVTRTVVGAAALAACLLLGIAVGWMFSPPPPMDPETDRGTLQLSHVPDQTPATVAIVDEPLMEIPVEIEPAVSDEEILIAEASTPIVAPSEETPPEITPSPAPVYRPRPVYRPVEPEPMEPAITEEPQTPEPSDGVEFADTEMPAIAGEMFHPAELTLRTIQALSERITSEDGE